MNAHATVADTGVRLIVSEQSEFERGLAWGTLLSEINAAEEALRLARMHVSHAEHSTIRAAFEPVTAEKLKRLIGDSRALTGRLEALLPATTEPARSAA